MPSDLFGDLNHRTSAVQTRRPSLFVASVAGHAGVVVGAIVISTMMSDVLPAPRTALAFFDNRVKIDLPPAPPPPSSPQPVTPVADAAPNPDAAPVTAPRTIEPEPADRPTARDTAPLAPGILGGIESSGAGLTTPVGVPERVIPKPQPAASQTPIRLHSGIQEPKRTTYVEPSYPTLAQSARVQGVVILEAVIDATGQVESVHVLRSIAMLDQAAITAVKQWRYTPALLNGVAVPVIITVTVNFTL